MRPLLLLCLAASAVVEIGAAQRPDSLGPLVRPYLRVTTSQVILEHVQVIDGTGAAPMPDRNVAIERGRITAISAGTDLPQRDGTTILDLRGHTVIPGIVGMHDHLFSMARPEDSPGLFVEMIFSAPRLYLANGVTTLRTAGSVAPYADVNLRTAIATGSLPGPDIDVTGPYLEGPGNPNPLIHQLTGPDDARQTVDYWADRGVTSFKAYAHITRAELGAAIAEAHTRGLKVTGHLCSVTYPEAIALGIDNLEHGFSANTELDPDKQPDSCSASGGDSTLFRMSPESPEARRLIALLVGHHVAITSTLPLRAAAVPGLDAVRPAVLEAMTPALRDAYLASRHPPVGAPGTALRLRREMDLERAFVASGGLLLAGSDPVGLGGNLPGFGDQKEIELLVEAGFTPVEAIRIATLNGAVYLGRQDRIGSIAVGKNADLVVVQGDPATHIADIENVAIVFKDGVGYDPGRLLAAVRGRYGEY